MSSDLTNSIINKWRQQGKFIRFIDGNTANCSVKNLTYISLKDAMSDLNLKVDWDMYLTQEEIKLVRNDQWRNGLKF